MVVLCRHHRRIVLEVSAPSESYVHVFGVAEAVQLPDARHAHVFPRCVVIVGAEEVGRTLVGVLHPLEAPVALDREEVA